MNSPDRGAEPIKYDQPEGYDPTAMAPWSIDRQSSALVPAGSRVLEIGCATGFLAQWLARERQCRVWGVELRGPEANIAAERVQLLMRGNIEDGSVMAQVRRAAASAGGFDVVFASSVLEHLQDPGRVLRDLATLLAPGGILIATLPNIVHWSMRLSLLLGRFDYQSYGILDRTHLRFFTLASALRLFAENGYAVDHVGFDPDRGVPIVSTVLRRLGGAGRAIEQMALRALPGLLAYQFVFRARPTAERGFEAAGRAA